MKQFKAIKSKFLTLAQKTSAVFAAPSEKQVQLGLLAFGVAMLGLGVSTGAGAVATINYNDVRLAASVNAILTYIEGTFGAMVMVAAGIGAILSSAFGQYRAALGLLVVAVGAFILRSLVGTFFNDQNIQQ